MHSKHLNGHGSPPGNRDSHGNYGGNSSPYNNFSGDGCYQYGRFDASALHIAHALKQTELQKGYSKAREKPIDFYLVNIFHFYLQKIINPFLIFRVFLNE